VTAALLACLLAGAPDGAALLERARLALGQGDLAAAEAALQDVPNDAPPPVRADAWLLRGNLRFERDEFAGAQCAYARAFTLATGGEPLPDAATRERLLASGEAGAALENWELAAGRRARRETLRARARNVRATVLVVLAAGAVLVVLAARAVRPPR